MSVDAQRIHDFCEDIHEWWSAPLFITVTMALLWQQLGPSSLAGLGLLVLMAPINGGYVMAQFTRLQVQVLMMHIKFFVIILFFSSIQTLVWPV